MKEAGHLKSTKPGAIAQASWDGFLVEHRNRYNLTAAGSALIEANPQVQIVTEGGLDFRHIEFGDDATDLDKVARHARTVRNNLFHGGKSSVEGWDDPDRIRQLIPLVIANLDELAELGDMIADYRREY